jgi:hypothetical protein
MHIYIYIYIYTYIILVDPLEVQRAPPSGTLRICIQLSRFELHLPTSSNGTDAICLLGTCICVCTYKLVSISYIYICIYTYKYLYAYVNVLIN